MSLDVNTLGALGALLGGALGGFASSLTRRRKARDHWERIERTLAREREAMIDHIDAALRKHEIACPLRGNGVTDELELHRKEDPSAG